MLKRLSGEAAWIFSGQVAAVVLQLLILRLLTNILTIQDYGLLSLLLVAATLIERTFMVVQAGVGRYYLEAVKENKLNQYWIASFQLLARSSIISLCVGIGILTIIPIFLPFHHYLPATFVLVSAIVTGWNTAFSGIHLSARNRSMHASFQIIEFASRFLFILALVKLVTPSLLTVTFGYFLSAIFLFVVQYRFILKLLGESAKAVPHFSFGRFSGEVARWRHSIWNYSSPFIAWGGFSWMQQSSDRFALETFLGSRAVGLYSIIFQLGYTPMIIFGTMANNFIQPILFARVLSPKSSDRGAGRNLTRISFGSSGVIFVISLLFAYLASSYHYIIMSLFVAEDFRTYSSLLPYIVLAGGIFAATNPLSSRLMAMKNTKQIFSINSLFSLLSISLNLLGAYFYGIPGVVKALLISSCLYWLFFFMSFLMSTNQTLVDS